MISSLFYYIILLWKDTKIKIGQTSPPDTGSIPDNKKEGKSFSEISGLEIEQQDIEYRTGNTPVHPKKQPGLSKHPNIELKRSDLDIGDQTQSESKGIIRSIVDFFRNLFYLQVCGKSACFNCDPGKAGHHS